MAGWAQGGPASPIRWLPAVEIVRQLPARLPGPQVYQVSALGGMRWDTGKLKPLVFSKRHELQSLMLLLFFDFGAVAGTQGPLCVRV